MRNILAFGDSNTWGLIPGTKDRFDWGIRWTSIVQNSVPDIRVIEEGLCGRTTIFEDELRPLRRAIDVLPMILESISPIDYAIVMLGTNDCKSRYNAGPYTICKGLEKCLNEVKKKLAPEKILVVSPIYLGEEVWRDDKDPEFSKQSIDVSKQLEIYYRELAKANGYQFIAASDYASASEVDQEHLDKYGHKRLAEAIISKL